MATVEPPKVKPGRLAKLGDGSPRFARKKGKGKAAQQQAVIQSPTPVQQPSTPSRIANCCNNPNPYFDESNGKTVCTNCFTELADANIVADVEFAEDSRGAPQLQGNFISENARHASTLGTAAQGISGATTKAPEDVARGKCQSTLAKIGSRIGVKEKGIIWNQTLMLYDLAIKSNFSAGRKTDEVVGACIYAIARQQSDNTIMLMDIAEALKFGVFRLGEVYKELCKELYLEPRVIESGKAVQRVPVVDVESLVSRFCNRLEFGSLTEKVAEDAIRIIARMKRDWMVTGRHPAGLCGAAIVLAARMNNFRRSIREIVWVVKITDMTILKRVMEFRRSKATALTVDQFRNFGTLLKDSNDPPALYESIVQKAKLEAKKRKRQEASEARDSSEAPDDGSPDSGNGDAGRRKRRRTIRDQSTTPAPVQDAPRRDADGFVIPALPNTNAQANEEEPPGRKRGRKKNPPPVDLSEAELITEELLSEEIKYVIEGDEAQHAYSQHQIDSAREYADSIAPQHKQNDAEQNKRRREAEDITWVREPQRQEEVTAEELEKEFADDPEVQNCLLSEDEQNAKEMIWIFNNEDWLRQQQEKKLIEAVAKAAGRNEKGKKPGKGAKKKRKGKMGDGTLLKNARENGDTPIDTPADATAAMLHERSTFVSSFINQAALENVFRRSPSSTSGSSTAQQASDGQAAANAGAEAAQDSSSSTRSTPAPASEAGRMPSPPITQQAGQATTTPLTPEPRRTNIRPPATPPQIQAQQAAEGADDEESEGDADDYLQEEDLDAVSENMSPGGEDDDFEQALDPEDRMAWDDDAYGDDDYY